MTVDPTGYPLWSRTADYTTYGGHADKANYQSQGAINPKTDVTAQEFSRMTEDMAMTGRVMGFCKLKLTCNDTAPAAPTIEWIRMMTGERSTSYAGDSPPTGFPAAARVGDGSVTVTFAATYSDAYGVSEAFTPAYASPNGASAGVAYCNYSITGSVVTVSAFDSASAAAADAEIVIEVG